MNRIFLLTFAVFVGGLTATSRSGEEAKPVALTSAESFHISTFSIDVTIPLNHRCMGVLPTKSKRILDPLYAHGFVVTGGEYPFVVCSIDWCEIRNGAYDQWRKALADAANTSPEYILLSAIHQHDAPIADRDAEKILAEVGLSGELYDVAFHDDVVRRAAQALRDSLTSKRRLTHIGVGQTKATQLASSRRVIDINGQVTYHRGSNSGGNPHFTEQPEGLIDPYLKVLSFWAGDEAVVALNTYAIHPMSYYGRGEVSADFVGMARDRRQRDDFKTLQIYASGCSGDVTAGKYNDGTPEMRKPLADRLYAAMVDAWQTTKKFPLQRINVRSTPLQLDFHPKPKLTVRQLEADVRNEEISTEKRILAAMGLASRQRVRRGKPIDLACVDFGPAQIVLFPAEAFVGYQIMAQQMRPSDFVVCLGYGECWPGYIPTKAAFGDSFDNTWLWVGPGSEEKIRDALTRVLLPQ